MEPSSDGPARPSSAEVSVPPVEDTQPARRSDFHTVKAEVQRLTYGFDKVTTNLRSLGDHLEQQDRQAETIARSLAELAKSLRHTSDALRAQLEATSATRDQIDQQTTRLDQIDQRLSWVDRLASSQCETRAAVDRLRDLGRETNARLTSEFEQLGRSVCDVTERTRAVSTTIEELRADLSAREERLASRIERRLHRYTLIAWAACGVAIVTGIIALIVSWVG